MNKKLLFFGIAIFTVIIFGFVYKVPYEVQVQKEIQIPYEDQEAYQEQELYREMIVPLSYKQTGLTQESCGIFSLCLYIAIQNTDTEGGTFRTDCTFRTLKRTLRSYDALYIGPGETVKLKCVIDLDYAERLLTKTDEYVKSPPIITITPSTKTLREYHTVTKYRNVTKYRTEVQTVAETRYHSLFSAWLDRK